MQRTGGFDVVLGNPPWVRIKLQEQEFFASARTKMIAALVIGPGERRVSDAFEQARRTAEAACAFARVPEAPIRIKRVRLALSGRAYNGREPMRLALAINRSAIVG